MKRVKTVPLIGSLIDECVAAQSQTGFVTGLRTGQLPLEKYLAYVLSSYPVVASFCQALNTMIGRFDPVNDAAVIQTLHRQGVEEIGHNNLWRAMLAAFGIDHHQLYTAYRTWRTTSGAGQIWNHGGWAWTKAALDDAKLEELPTLELYDQKPPIPEPVLGLVYHMEETSGDGNPWVYFACQTAIEAVILRVVTQTIYPAVKASPTFNRGPKSTAWWREHADIKTAGRKPNTEARHITVASSIINKQITDAATKKTVITAVKVTLRLFSAVTQWHDHRTFNYRPYLSVV
jgi:hypothetical protein